MPATVRAVLAAPGVAAKKGETLLIVEAMKMELALRAPIDGVVQAVHCKVGDLVQPDVPLVELAPGSQ
jgi:3-methylcrotonyl-CoA carboxylase alpha subunit